MKIILGQKRQFRLSTDKINMNILIGGKFFGFSGCLRVFFQPTKDYYATP